MPSRKWLEIYLERAGTRLKARAQSCKDQQAFLPTLGPASDVEQLGQFTQQVREAAAHAEPLGQVLGQAQALHRALFQGELQEVLQRLRGTEDTDKLLLRLMLPKKDPALQEFPWEALCEPDTISGFLGNASDVLLARGVNSKEPMQPREVRGPVRLLAIAPSGGEALTMLRVALEESIVAGEVEWLEPLVGPRARLPRLFDRLQCEPLPHILHFIGHGGFDEKGEPQLRLADDEDGQELWLSVEVLAKQLQEARKFLRLIVLDACEGARPGALASAAEWLTYSAADAVVAHLWPVKADLARMCSAAFYRTLTRAAQPRGDVACSLHHARLMVLAAFRGSAEAFSPVLYLRGHDSILFEFRGRRVSPPPDPSLPSDNPAADAHSPALHRLLEQPFTLVLGDRWKAERDVLNAFRDQLRKELARKVGTLPEGLPMSALTQHYALRFGEGDLDMEFQRAFGRTAASLPVLGTLARKLVPGFHITLLRLPLLELALAEEQPERTLFIIQPSGTDDGEQATVLEREGGARSWRKLHDLPESFDLSRDIVILRNYCGYIPPLDDDPSLIYVRPFITEDQYLLAISDVASLLPGDLAESLKGALNLRPALLLGLSILTWHHRMLLHRLFGRSPLPRGSLVVLEPEDKERALWKRGSLLLPTREGVQVLELSARALGMALEAMGPEAPHPPEAP